MGSTEVAVDTALYLALKRIHKRFGALLDIERDRFRVRVTTANNHTLAMQYEKQIELLKHAEMRGAEIVELAKTKHLPTIIVRYLSFLLRHGHCAGQPVSQPSEYGDRALGDAALVVAPFADKLLNISKLGRPFPEETIRRANAILPEKTS